MGFLTRLCPVIIVTAAMLFSDATASVLDFEIAVLDKIERQFGLAARQRLVNWANLINANAGLTDQEKLRKVNDFFNQNTAFIDDSILWNASDYWATPIEFLLKGAGDCEDYSIAKYFTLVEMGVDESKLRITYVKALELNQAHMVLTYYESPQVTPLILDNLVPLIQSAAQRHDLLPIYSFNGTSLWLTKNTAAGSPVGSSDSLSLWQDLKQRALAIPLPD